MTSLRKVTESNETMELSHVNFLEESKTFNSCDTVQRRKYLFEKKIFLINHFHSMRHNVDKNCQKILEKRLNKKEKYLYENYFKYIQRMPTPTFDMKKVYSEQQNIIDQINSYEKKYETLDQAQHLLNFCEEIHDRLLYFSKNFYTFGFAQIDMDIKSLRAFSVHMRFYPEELDELI
jgi:hypothetical protein